MPRPGCARLLMTASIAAAAFFAVAVRAADDTKPTDAKPADTAPARPAGSGAGTVRPDPGQYLKLQRDRLNELNLTDDQKTKIDALYTKATEEVKAAAAADPQERRQKMGELMMGLRKDVAEVLTDEQKAKFAAMGPAAVGRPNPVARLEDAISKLDLTAEQKPKVQVVVEDAKKKFEELRGQLPGGDRAAVREKFTAFMDETRDKLKEILTPEQQEKLREALQAGAPGAGPGPANPAPATANPAPATEKPK